MNRKRSQNEAGILKSRAKTKRQESISAEWFARDDPSRPEPERFQYEKVLYQKCLESEQKRKAFDFLNACRNYILSDHDPSEPPMDILAWLQYSDPLLHAISGPAIDEEFLEGLLEAAKILNSRRYNSKDPDIGTDLNKWLLEYKSRVRWGTAAEQTPHELNKQEISKFHSISDKKLHERLHQLEIPHKNEPRGKASPMYGHAQLNLPPKRRKTGKF